jgi:hypothetical protein
VGLGLRWVPGLHQLALFMLVAAALFLALTVADRSLGRVGGSPLADDDNKQPPGPLRIHPIPTSAA